MISKVFENRSLEIFPSYGEVTKFCFDLSKTLICMQIIQVHF